ncbi:hypothetical protein D3C76_1665390 [compost metagenome]
MPDNSVKLFDYLDNTDLVAKRIFENGIVATKLSVEGDTLENYFLSVVGGNRNA